MQKTFTRELEIEDWTRFQTYANRVRHLTIRESMVFMTKLFAEAARTRLTLCLTPNLIHLEILCEPQAMRNAIMFLHPGLTYLTLTLSPDSQSDDNLKKDAFRRFFSELIFRSPNITDLHLKFREPIQILPFECVLVYLFRGLSSLQNLTLPRWTLTPFILAALSDHPKVTNIQNNLFPKEIGGLMDDIPEFNPFLKKNAFLELRTLYFQTGFRQVNFFFCAEFAPANITKLYLEILRQDSEEDSGMEFMCGIAENCLSLTHLTLNIKDGYGEWKAFNAADLRTLSKFRALRNFTFIHSCAVSVNDEEIDHLARNWPTLESFILNPEPQLTRYRKLSLDCLVSFARYCPNLHTLGLFIDASQSYLASTKTVRFKNLRNLTFGLSPVSNPKSVALHLSRLCSLSTHTVLQQSLSEEGPLEGISDEQLGYKMLWAYVMELLPLFLIAREEERMEIKKLQQAAMAMDHDPDGRGDH